ncbi:hypothetical protein N7490_006420 [Penicillium lividum]|nr:hypothetical protein N7490_006420 [Penicillium lividum]
MKHVAASIAMSLRKAFEGDLIPISSEHPHPLSWLAQQIRRAINVQGTPSQHEAYYAAVRTGGHGLPIAIFGDGGMAQVGFSNWSKAGLFDLDFSPAIKEPKGDNAPCDDFFIFGKDQKGNYLASAYKLKGQWEKFQEQMKKDFEVDT